MKSSYELAMERLSKAAPAIKLTASQKKQIAELESKYKAKIAEREIATDDEIGQALAGGHSDKVVELKQRLVDERRKLQAQLEEQKEAVRAEK